MEGEPVPGWNAEPTIVNNSPNRRAHSFHVRSCPKFVPYHKRSKIEIGRIGEMRGNREKQEQTET
jgi:hypothetical protein